MDLQSSVVAILNDKNKIIGTGFVAGENLILICAYVIETPSAGLKKPVGARFASKLALMLSNRVSVPVTSRLWPCWQ